MSEWLPPSGPSDDPESIETLLRRAQAGDRAARDRLFDLCYRWLQAVARGRLTPAQRRLADTNDLVQNTLFKAFRRLEQFESRGADSFLRYLSRILLNEVLQVARKAKRENVDGTPGDHLDPRETPSSQAERRQTRERYLKALMQLTEAQREAVNMRIELGLGYREIAEALGKPSANAARMFVARALAEVARLMRASGDGRANGDGR